jgi:multisubunit Na+/H+ antiporter MnhG subunit
MYCPSCGTEVTRELNYCNRCGANLNLSSNLPEQPQRPVSLTGPTIGIAVMVVVGLGIIFSSISNLARSGVHPVALTWMIIAGMAMITGVAAMVIRQWSHLAGVSKRQEQKAPRKKPVADEAAPIQLPSMRSTPVSSVTDHTTRTFEPVYRNPRERGKS